MKQYWFIVTHKDMVLLLTSDLREAKRLVRRAIKKSGAKLEDHRRLEPDVRSYEDSLGFFWYITCKEASFGKEASMIFLDEIEKALSR